MRTVKKRKNKTQRVAVWDRADALKDVLVREVYQGNLKRELHEFSPADMSDIEVAVADFSGTTYNLGCVQ